MDACIRGSLGLLSGLTDHTLRQLSPYRGCAPRRCLASSGACMYLAFLHCCCRLQTIIAVVDSRSVCHEWSLLLQVFLCYRRRGLGERQFAQMASAVGWLAQEVDSCLLHSEFQGGAYRLICLSRLG